MSTDPSATLDDDAIDAFLARRGTGVLALADDDTPYATPVSYGFDPAEPTFYFRLGFVADSEKRRFVGSATEARFVVYDRTDDGWVSVVGVGELEPVGREALTAEIANALRAGDIPLFDIWGDEADELAFEIYRLPVDRLTGRTAPADGD